jgi:hypothetical protein
LKLSALAVEGTDPITKDVGWDIFGEADAEGNRRKAGTATKRSPHSAFLQANTSFSSDMGASGDPNKRLK